MRWFVLEGWGEPGVGAHIVAEAVAEVTLDGTFTERESRVVCDDRNLVSREELLATEEGKRALMRWESGDDSAYEEATRRFLADVLAEDERLFSA